MSIRRSQPRIAVTAFTLIELLVVVAIIGILISILLPSLAAARRQSRQLLCLTNLSAMGKAARVYAQENHDTLVQGDDRLPGGTGDTRSHWVASLMPGLEHPEYVNNLFRRTPGVSFTGALHEVCKKTKQMQCPDFPEPRQSLDYVVNAFPIPVYPNFSAISSTTGPGPVAAPAGREPSLYFRYAKSGRADHSKTIYVTEAHHAMPLPPPDGTPFPANHIWGQLVDVFISNHMALASQPRVANDRRHPAGIAAMMFDGHAEVLPLQQIDPGPPRNVYDRVRRFSHYDREPP